MKKAITITCLGAILIFSISSCKKKIYGCTDETADNFSTLATINDESCIYKTPNVIKSETTFYTTHFSGSGGYYTATFTISNLSDNDAVFFEWKCGTCGSYESIPKTWDDFLMVSVNRNGSNFTLENSIYDGSTITTAPFYDLLNGQVLKAYVINYDAIVENNLDLNDYISISKFVHENI